MTGGAGFAHTEYFRFSKLPETGQIYLDKYGTICATEGWPHNRPMAGLSGEVMDFVTPYAAIRWTRKEDAGTTVVFGQAQVARAAVTQPIGSYSSGGGGGGGFCDGCGTPRTGAFCTKCGKAI